MLYTSELFAIKQLMECHERVEQGVKSRRESQAAAAALTTTTSTCVKPADSVNMSVSLGDPGMRSQKTKAEVENDAMHDRGSRADPQRVKEHSQLQATSTKRAGDDEVTHAQRCTPSREQDQVP